MCWNYQPKDNYIELSVDGKITSLLALVLISYIQPFMDENKRTARIVSNAILMRLVSDTSEFISNYVDLVEQDAALKFEHKQQWNVIISSR